MFHVQQVGLLQLLKHLQIPINNVVTSEQRRQISDSFNVFTYNPQHNASIHIKKKTPTAEHVTNCNDTGLIESRRVYLPPTMEEV